MSKMFLAGGFLIALATAAPSEAAVVSFDFSASNSGGWANSLSYSAGGVDLSVTGGDTKGGSGQVATWAGHGLGMKSRSDCVWFGLCLGTDHQIDAKGHDDVVTFTFSKAVSITSLLFNYVDAGDTFDFGADGVALYNAVVAPVVAVNNVAGTIFTIGAGTTKVTSCSARMGYRTPYCVTQVFESAFKLKGMTVSVPDEPAPVPLPGGALLLLGALGGMAALRRRMPR